MEKREVTEQLEVSDLKAGSQVSFCPLYQGAIQALAMKLSNIQSLISQVVKTEATCNTFFNQQTIQMQINT